MKTAKELGYKVIDEFDVDISSIVRLKIENDKVIKVIDEFDIDIKSRVKVTK